MTIPLRVHIIWTRASTRGKDSLRFHMVALVTSWELASASPQVLPTRAPMALVGSMALAGTRKARSRASQCSRSSTTGTEGIQRHRRTQYQTSYGGGYVQYGYGQMQPAMPMQWQGEGHATHRPTVASDSSGPEPQDAARRELFPPTFQQRMQTAESNRDGAVGMRRRLGGGRGGGGSQSQWTACSPGPGMTPLSEVQTSVQDAGRLAAQGHTRARSHRRCWGLGRCASRWRSR
jgi:hypothetical protein